MVPKPYKTAVTPSLTFGTMTNRMVPKPRQFQSLHSDPSFGTMTNRMAPKPRILLFNMIGVD